MYVFYFHTKIPEADHKHTVATHTWTLIQALVVDHSSQLNAALHLRMRANI